MHLLVAHPRLVSEDAEKQGDNLISDTRNQGLEGLQVWFHGAGLESSL